MGSLRNGLWTSVIGPLLLVGCIQPIPASSGTPFVDVEMSATPDTVAGLSVPALPPKPPAPKPAQTPPDKPRLEPLASEPIGSSGRSPDPLISAKVDRRTQQAKLPPAERLVGLAPEDAVRMFGLPTAIEEQPPALVWRYSQSRCELALFFYMDLESERLRTLTYDLTSSETGKPSDACLSVFEEELGNNRG
jgi:hypothetical protein